MGVRQPNNMKLKKNIGPAPLQLLQCSWVAPTLLLAKSRQNYYFYRPQQCCGKVMFSQACVKNSVHKGGVYPTHAPQGTHALGHACPPVACTPPGKHAPWHAHTPPRHSPPRHAPPWARSPPDTTRCSQ